jgi:hypothetical protein
MSQLARGGKQAFNQEFNNVIICSKYVEAVVGKCARSFENNPNGKKSCGPRRQKLRLVNNMLK